MKISIFGLLETEICKIYSSCFTQNSLKSMAIFFNLVIFLKRVCSQLLSVGSLFLEFQNDAWLSLDKFKGGCGAPRTFHLAPLSFEYSARQKCVLSFGRRVFTLPKNSFPSLSKIIFRKTGI